VAFTWYVMIGAIVTFATGCAASRFGADDTRHEEKTPA